MLKFMVPVDMSLAAKKACFFSTHIAEKLGAEIMLVHSYTRLLYEQYKNATFPEEQSLTLIQGSKDEVIRQEIENSLMGLIEEMNRYCNEKNISLPVITTHIVTGYPEKAIIEQSQNLAANLLIIGTQSKGESIKELLGSLTSDIIRKSSIPVLTIPSGFEMDFSTMDNLIYATNFDDSDYSSISRLTELLEPFDIKFNCVHFATGDAISEKEKIKLDELKTDLEVKYPTQFESCEIIQGENTLECLDALLKEKKISLIAVTHHKRQSLFPRLVNKSFVKSLLFNSDVPLLVFHA